MSAPAPSANIAITQAGSRFGHTQISGGLLLQGNFAGLTINSTASPRAEYVGPFAHTSLQPVKAYVQRPALCDRIREQLHDTASQGEGQYTTLLVVWGLGGAGKTQLVLDYLRRYRNEYKATFWIEAGSKGSIERDFIHIYQLLFDIRISAGQDPGPRVLFPAQV